MRKVVVICWRGTDNTEVMANAVAEGVKENNTPDDAALASCMDWAE